MKKKMVLTMLLAVAMQVVLVGCGSNNSVVIEDGNLEPAVEAAEDASVEEKESKEVSQSTDKDITVQKHNVQCKSGDTVLAEGYYPEIVLNDKVKEEYPKLAEAIGEVNSKLRDDSTKAISYHGYYAKENNIDTGLSTGNNVEIKRADGKVLTFSVENYWEASASINVSIYTMSIDYKTGEEIKPDKFITDSAAFVSGIEAEVQKNYPELYEQYSDNFSMTLNNSIESGTLNCSIIEEGIRVDFDEVYFSRVDMPDDVHVVLSYDDYPGLVAQEYVVDSTQDLKNIVEYRDAEGEAMTVEPSEDYTF